MGNILKWRKLVSSKNRDKYRCGKIVFEREILVLSEKTVVTFIDLWFLNLISDFILTRFSKIVCYIVKQTGNINAFLLIWERCNAFTSAGSVNALTSGR